MRLSWPYDRDTPLSIESPSWYVTSSESGNSQMLVMDCGSGGGIVFYYFKPEQTTQARFVEAIHELMAERENWRTAPEHYWIFDHSDSGAFGRERPGMHRLMNG